MMGKRWETTKETIPEIATKKKKKIENNEKNNNNNKEKKPREKTRAT